MKFEKVFLIKKLSIESITKIDKWFVKWQFAYLISLNFIFLIQKFKKVVIW